MSSPSSSARPSSPGEEKRRRRRQRQGVLLVEEQQQQPRSTSPVRHRNTTSNSPRRCRVLVPSPPKSRTNAIAFVEWSRSMTRHDTTPTEGCRMDPPQPPPQPQQESHKTTPEDTRTRDHDHAATQSWNATASATETATATQIVSVDSTVNVDPPNASTTKQQQQQQQRRLNPSPKKKQSSSSWVDETTGKFNLAGLMAKVDQLEALASEDNDVDDARIVSFPITTANQDSNNPLVVIQPPLRHEDATQQNDNHYHHNHSNHNSNAETPLGSPILTTQLDKAALTLEDTSATTTTEPPSTAAIGATTSTMVWDTRNIMEYPPDPPSDPEKDDNDNPDGNNDSQTTTTPHDTTTHEHTIAGDEASWFPTDAMSQPQQDNVTVALDACRIKTTSHVPLSKASSETEENESNNAMLDQQSLLNGGSSSSLLDQEPLLSQHPSQEQQLSQLERIKQYNNSHMEPDSSEDEHDSEDDSDASSSDDDETEEPCLHEPLVEEPDDDDDDDDASYTTNDNDDEAELLVRMASSAIGRQFLLEEARSNPPPPPPTPPPANSPRFFPVTMTTTTPPERPMSSFSFSPSKQRPGLPLSPPRQKSTTDETSFLVRSDRTTSPTQRTVPTTGEPHTPPHLVRNNEEDKQYKIDSKEHVLGKVSVNVPSTANDDDEEEGGSDQAGLGTQPNKEGSMATDTAAPLLRLTKIAPPPEEKWNKWQASKGLGLTLTTTTTTPPNTSMRIDDVMVAIQTTTTKMEQPTIAKQNDALPWADFPVTNHPKDEGPEISHADIQNDTNDKGSWNAFPVEYDTDEAQEEGKESKAATLMLNDPRKKEATIDSDEDVADRVGEMDAIRPIHDHEESTIGTCTDTITTAASMIADRSLAATVLKSAASSPVKGSISKPRYIGGSSPLGDKKTIYISSTKHREIDPQQPRYMAGSNTVEALKKSPQKKGEDLSSVERNLFKIADRFAAGDSQEDNVRDIAKARWKAGHRKDSSFSSADDSSPNNTPRKHFLDKDVAALLKAKGTLPRSNSNSSREISPPSHRVNMSRSGSFSGQMTAKLAVASSTAAEKFEVKYAMQKSSGSMESMNDIIKLPLDTSRSLEKEKDVVMEQNDDHYSDVAENNGSYLCGPASLRENLFNATGIRDGSCSPAARSVMRRSVSLDKRVARTTEEAIIVESSLTQSKRGHSIDDNQIRGRGVELVGGAFSTWENSEYAYESKTSAAGSSLDSMAVDPDDLEDTYEGSSVVSSPIPKKDLVSETDGVTSSILNTSLNKMQDINVECFDNENKNESEMTRGPSPVDRYSVACNEDIATAQKDMLMNESDPKSFNVSEASPRQSSDDSLHLNGVVPTTESTKGNPTLIVPKQSPSPFEASVWNTPSIVAIVLGFLGDPVAVCKMKMVNRFTNRIISENEHVIMRDAVRAGGLSRHIRPAFWLWIVIEGCGKLAHTHPNSENTVEIAESKSGASSASENNRDLGLNQSSSDVLLNKPRPHDFITLEQIGRAGEWHRVIQRDITRAFGNMPPHKTGAKLRADSIVRALVYFGKGRLIRRGVRGGGEAAPTPQLASATGEREKPIPRPSMAPPPWETWDDDSEGSGGNISPSDTVSDWGGVSPVGSTLSVASSHSGRHEKIKDKERGGGYGLTRSGSRSSLRGNKDHLTQSIEGAGSPSAIDKIETAEIALSGNSLTYEMKQDLQNKLGFILHALAAAHGDVGYCQGMDYVVAHLLRVLQETVKYKDDKGTLPICIATSRRPHARKPDIPDPRAKVIDSSSLVVEETVFRVMDAFMSRYNLRHMYWPELRCLKTCCRVFECLIQRKLPVLADHFEHHELNVGLFALGWFQTLFLYLPSMPSATVCHMWDIWLVERSFKIFFRVGTAILFLSQPILLNHDLEGMMTYLNTFPDATLLNPDILIACALQIKVTNRMLLEMEMEVTGGNGTDSGDHLHHA